MSAAYMCQLACMMIAKMEERGVREYVTAAYFIACDMTLNERAVESLARDVQDGRYKNGVPFEVVKGRHITLSFLVYISSKRHKDTRSRHAICARAEGILLRGPTTNVVGEIILEHGPDRLRRVAQRKAKLIEGAQKWAKQGKNPAAPSFDEVLATLVAEEAKAATTGEGGRDIRTWVARGAA